MGIAFTNNDRLEQFRNALPGIISSIQTREKDKAALLAVKPIAEKYVKMGLDTILAELETELNDLKKQKEHLEYYVK
jgi:2-keto-3-deoxy-L-rhamnonate aldolase RhmA